MLDAIIEVAPELIYIQKHLKLRCLRHDDPI